MKSTENLAWPAVDLEALDACEVCGSTDRPVWLAGLADRIFGVAPGRWQLRRCTACGVAALDPRPTEASIGRAYARYYTHDAGPERHFLVPGDRPDLWLKRALHADHYNRVYGHRLAPALPLGRWLIGANASRRARAGHYIRHLPAPVSTRARLLDLGCGSGSFLRVARALGFEAEGLEIDEASGRLARDAGFDVFAGSLGSADYAPARFEQVTLNHVVEHLHQPLQALQRVWGWLRPGGRIWLQTPNLGSRGAARYGAAWRGLETPRHLALFEARSLCAALAAAGFVHARLLPPQRDAGFFIQQSEAIQAGRDPYQAARLSPAQRQLARRWNSASLADWGSAEAITVEAWRPA
jgi:2-polyprenyl-3-methyl-5-hydroxy-6-metoxy-1,4-benzoquinol methylase